MTEDPGAPPVSSRPVVRLRHNTWAETDDTLVVEEPLEIRVDDRRFTVTMRTPGQDFDLARGLLFAEGVIRAADDIAGMRYCDDADDGEDAINVLNVRLRRAPESTAMWQRNLISGTSCGLCGKAAIEAVCRTVVPLPENSGAARVDAARLMEMPEALRVRQALFEQTGGLHAAGVFTVTGDCLAAAEDIGRHNATDKVIGRGLDEGWLPANPAEPLILLVSGRASFEIVQKVGVARIPILCSVSAASALAVDLAAAGGQTLIGFLRGSGMTVYTGGHRLAPG